MGTTSLAQTTMLKGLGLPALRGAGGYFAVKNRYDVAWSDLMIALFTPIGGRAFDRSFGSGLHHVLFSPVTVAVDQLANYTVKQAAALWCPHVTVIDLSRPDFRAVQINKSSVIQLLQAANNG